MRGATAAVCGSAGNQQSGASLLPFHGSGSLGKAAEHLNLMR